MEEMQPHITNAVACKIIYNVIFYEPINFAKFRPISKTIICIKC